MLATGDQCSLVTNNDPGGSKNPLQVTNRGSQSAELQILDEAELPRDLAEEALEEESHSGVGGKIVEIITGVIQGILESFGGGGESVLSGLHVAADGGANTSAPGAAAARSTLHRSARPGSPAHPRPPLFTVSYRDRRAATTVLTLARASRGVRRGGRCGPVPALGAAPGRTCTRWVKLGGRRLLARSDRYFTPAHRSAGRPGGCPRGTSRAAEGRCRLRLRLYGHLRHRDSVGANLLRFSRIDGRPLAAGRYRLTALALSHGVLSKPLATTFTAGG